jgi:3-dehydroquinate synthase
MTTFTIETSGAKSEIHVGSRLQDFVQMVPRHAVIITDKNVQEMYGKHWKDYQCIVIGTGEKIKTLDTVEDIFKKLLSFGIDRSGFILGIGGGIVCDIAGFVASTYLRGIDFAFAPTTLLSQVDASIGGKNGVNFLGFKNMIGTFNQPKFILSDPEVLKTLPQEELANGFAEAVKHALIADLDYFEFFEKNVELLLGLNPQAINHLIQKSVELKSAIVNRDEKEKGERRKLNFGHTYGHAIEKVSGISHGKAVSIGSVVAAKLSLQKGLISNSDLDRIIKVLKNLDLPVSFNIDNSKVLDAMLKDKKREQDSIHFVLLTSIGSAEVEKISVGDLQKLDF